MADVAIGTQAFNDRYHFLIRRLHSLSGIIPIGAFLCVHLAVNATIVAGPNAYQYAVDRIHTLDSLGILTIVEILFIFIPIAFHAVLGIVITLQGRWNTSRYLYGGNFRYTMQRITGFIALLFIVAHLWHIHWIIPGGDEFDPHAAAASTIEAMRAGWTVPVYAIGIASATFHFANGIWTFLIVWGITIGERAQTKSGVVCAIIGVVLTVFGVASLATLKTMDLSKAAPAGHTALPAHTWYAAAD